MSFIEEKGHLQYTELFICVILRGCLFQGYFVHFKTSREYILILSKIVFPNYRERIKVGVGGFNKPHVEYICAILWSLLCIVLCSGRFEHLGVSQLFPVRYGQCLVLCVFPTQAPDAKNHLNHKRKRFNFLCNLSCLLVIDSLGLFGQVFSCPTVIQAGVLY